MKPISIQELHARTVVRRLPEAATLQTPYFAHRRFINKNMRRWIETGELGRGGTDITAAITEDREDGVS
jgi:hypothetical protein